MLFELATEGPGFAVDEDPSNLGEVARAAAVVRALPARDRAEPASAEACRPPNRRRHDEAGELSSSTSTNEARARPRPRFSSCTEPAATSTTCCRWVARSRPAPTCSVQRAGPRKRTAAIFPPVRGRHPRRRGPRTARRRARRLRRRCRRPLWIRQVTHLPPSDSRTARTSRPALLLSRPELLSGAVLFRAMVTLLPDPLPSLSARVLISNGRSDPLVSSDETERLAALLRRTGAHVDIAWQPGGHQLTQGDVTVAQRWLLQTVTTNL